VIEKEDKIVLPNGDEYEIEWIDAKPYEILVGISKTKVNNFTDSVL
jgi:hypothetical protein